MKVIIAAVLFMFAIQFSVSHASADMYKWVDENGVVHFSDTPPASEKDVETIETPDYPSPPPRDTPDKPRTNTEAKPKDESRERVKSKAPRTDGVEIFTTSWCGYCKRATRFLRSNGIKYKQHDIEKDPKAAARMKSLGGPGGVPFAIINGKQVYGFSEKSYRKALGLR